MTDETQAAPEGAADDTTLAAQVEGDDQIPEGETPGDDAAAQASEGKKPKQSPEDRINELTWKWREAERREAALLDRLGRPAPAQAAPHAESKEPAKPDPSDAKYEANGGVFDPQYVEDVAAWRAEQIVSKHLAQSEARTHAQSVRSKFEARAEEVATKNPDFYDAVGGTEFAKLPHLLSQPMQITVAESPLGPDIAYHLAKNPAEARRIAALSPHSQAREIGKLEARLEGPTTPPGKKITDAPGATPQVRGAGGQFKAAPDTDDFAAFQKAYP